MNSICIVPVSPMRSEPSHRSEMVSQLLFGELCEVIEEVSDWKKVRCQFDGYEGWCQDYHVIEYAQPKSSKVFLTSKYISTVSFNERPMHVPLGADVSFCFNQAVNVSGFNISYDGDILEPRTPEGTQVAKLALEYLNTSYLWGGKSSFGIDCSGFVQTVFKFFGITLLRDAYLQAGQGEEVGFLEETKTGDLAFFDNEAGKITHVGLILTPNTIIHSSGKVRIDSIDHNGIVNGDSGRRSHKLRLIKRYF